MAAPHLAVADAAHSTVGAAPAWTGTIPPTADDSAVLPGVKALLDKLAAMPTVPPSAIPAATRRGLFLAFAGSYAGELLPLPRIEDHSVPAEAPARSIGVRAYYPRIPAAGEKLPTFLFVHGGGWHAGSLTSHDAIVRRLCAASGCLIVAVDYRLAPEHPAPAGLEDVMHVHAWLHSDAAAALLPVDTGKLGLVGDSAGANLAAAAVPLVAAGGHKPHALVLLYPSLDLTCSSGASYETFKEGFYIRTVAVHHYVNVYLKGRAAEAGAADASATATAAAAAAGGAAAAATPATDAAATEGPLAPTDTRISPLFLGTTTLAATFPPTHIASAQFDPLLSDAIAFEAALAAAGVPVTHKTYAGMIHAWMHLQNGSVPEVVPSLVEIGQQMRRTLLRE